MPSSNNSRLLGADFNINADSIVNEYKHHTIFDACADLKSDLFLVKMFSYGITTTVILINFIVGQLTYKLIMWIKMANKS